MLIPLWVIWAMVSLYFSVGVIYAFVGFLSGPTGLTFREFLLCLFFWPHFLVR